MYTWILTIKKSFFSGHLHLIDADRLGWWLCERQLPSGGLNGRPEKLPDVCYSWWVLSTLTILGRLHWIDKKGLVRKRILITHWLIDASNINYLYFSHYRLIIFWRVKTSKPAVSAIDPETWSILSTLYSVSPRYRCWTRISCWKRSILLIACRSI